MACAERIAIEVDKHIAYINCIRLYKVCRGRENEVADTSSPMAALVLAEGTILFYTKSACL